MAGTCPNNLQEQIKKHITKLATYTPSTTLYAALMVSDSTDAAPGTECSDSGYTRQAVTLASLFADNGQGSVKLNTTIDWGAAAVQYVVHAVEFFDAASSGNRALPYIPQSPNVTIPINEYFELPAGTTVNFGVS